jgi:hypothetical protein
MRPILTQGHGPTCLLGLICALVLMADEPRNGQARRALLA